MKNYLFLERLSAVIILAMLLNSESNCQTLLIENFSYQAGTALTANGWSAHSGPGTNPVKVYSSGLSFQGYPSSNIGLSAILGNNGEDVNRTFTNVTSGNIFCAFLVRVDTIAEDYFLHFGSTPLSANKGRVYIKGSGNSLNFGLLKGTGTPVYTSGTSYNTGIVYLIVLKYSIVSGADNDMVSLFVIIGSITDTEPVTPTLGPITDNSEDLAGVSALALRQYSVKQDIIVDGIRVATRWEDAVSSLTSVKNYDTDIQNKVYPSPALGEINIENCKDVSLIEIFDLSGKKVMAARNNGNIIVHIPVNKLNNGLYIIRLKTSEGDRYLKFAKA